MSTTDRTYLIMYTFTLTVGLFTAGVLVDGTARVTVWVVGATSLVAMLCATAATASAARAQRRASTR